MIKPYGSEKLAPLFVHDAKERDALAAEANGLVSITVSSATAANAVMLGGGYFNPLTGYMTLADAQSVAENMRTSDGLFWPTPVLNMTDDVSAIKNERTIALRDPNVDGAPVLAVQEVTAVEEVGEDQLLGITEMVYGATDKNHPGVAAFLSQGRYLVSGPVRTLNFSYFSSDFPDTFRTAVQIRNEIKELGWQKVVGFQTRNPMHRAHEELCRMAQEAAGADGILIHMLLGKLKPGDIPAPVRDASIRKMAQIYFPPNSVLITGYGFDMLYAGPREAVLHAVFRQNAGCTHFIIGRDHAGVGDYYGPFDAQTIFDTSVPDDALQIEIFRADHTAWSKKLNKVVMMRDAPDHDKDDFVLLSGTKVRDMLKRGESLPVEFARPEVAKILMDYYQSLP